MQNDIKKQIQSIKPILFGRNTYLLGLLFLFILLQTFMLPYPALFCDESSVGFRALTILEDLPMVFSDFNTFSQHFTRGYHGAQESFILAMIFTVLPVGPLSLRVLAVISSVATIILLYFFSRELFDRRIAMTAFTIMSLSPVYMMGSRLGVEHANYMHILLLGILYLLLKWKRKAEDRYLYISCFLIGLGLWSRLWFLWFAAALIPTMILFFKQLPFKRERIYLRYPAVCTLLLTLGCLPAVYSEIVNGFPFLITFIKQRIVAENTNYLDNLFAAAKNFSDLISGRYYHYKYYHAESSFWNFSLNPYLLALTLLFALYLIFRKGSYRYKKALAFIVALIFFMFMQTIHVSVGRLPDYHYFFFLPLIYIILAVSAVGIWDRFKNNRLLKISSITLAAIYLCIELIGIGVFSLKLFRREGKRFHSPVIYELSDYLVEMDPPKVVLANWGIRFNIDIASGNRIKPKEAYWKSYGSLQNIAPGGTFIILYAPPDRNRKSYVMLAEKKGIELEKIKEFKDYEGDLIYVVFRVL